MTMLMLLHRYLVNLLHDNQNVVKFGMSQDTHILNI